jgi:hypothetical protein
MGTVHEIYVRKQTANDLIGFRPELAKFEFWQSDKSEYIGFSWSDLYAPRELLQELSTHFATDVLWIALQSAVDAFSFEHWCVGDCSRRLVRGYVDQYLWEAEAEPWEAEAFFSPDELEELLGEHPQDFEYRNKLKVIWRSKLLVVGNFEPLVSVWNTRDLITDFYGLPEL